MTSMPLAVFLHSVSPNSDAGLTWAHVARDLWADEPDIMRHLVTGLLNEGQQEPVMIGDDGRLWDGHHRVVALMALAADTVLVRYWADLTEQEQMDALIESCGDWEYRGMGL